MTQAGFIAAMAAEITFGNYHSPVTVGPRQSEWVIVSSWGENGDFLSLSLTNASARRLGPAPRGLQPVATHLGLLLARSTTMGREEAEYLLMRQQPADVAVGGIFHPSDGFVRVQRQNGDMSLIARGRYAHCRGTWQGQSIVRDIPDPAPNYEHARAWHLTAVQRPWIGEFTPKATAGTPEVVVDLQTPRSGAPVPASAPVGTSVIA